MRNLDSCRNVPALADVIWSERALVERLRYKLVVAKLVLAADLREMIAISLAEIEEAVGALGAAELTRAEAIARVAADWQLPPAELTLARLAQEAPEPWSIMFEDHRAAFAALTEEIAASVAEGQRLASTSLRTIQGALGTLTGPSAEGYNARGLAAAGAARPTRVDQAL